MAGEQKSNNLKKNKKSEVLMGQLKLSNIHVFGDQNEK